jgi:hypothetical protein
MGKSENLHVYFNRRQAEKNTSPQKKAASPDGRLAAFD